MIVTWPTDIPQTILTDWGVEYANGLDNPDGMHDGSQNRIRTNPERNISCFMICTLAEWVAFKTFFKTTLNEGLQAFSAGWISTLGFTHHFARIMSPPTAQKNGPELFKVQLLIELTTQADTNGVWVFED